VNTKTRQSKMATCGAMYSRHPQALIQRAGDDDDDDDGLNTLNFHF